MPLALYCPKDEASSLLAHYYSNICQVVSSYDSPQNPYRSVVSTMMFRSPIIFNSVMAISASHLSQFGSAETVPISFQTEVISHISKGIAEMDIGWNTNIPFNEEGCLNQIQPLATSAVEDDLLIGIILLGMTSVSIGEESLNRVCVACYVYRVGMALLLWVFSTCMARADFSQSG